ncbi:MAG: T9SS type A sorting domain-containing protein [Bacteroidales bacterium]|nr:T9SS type A sorting domain-containing protein [Bacteroidales bacterium]
MVKKLFVFAMGLMLAAIMVAQVSPKTITMSASDIQYWVGTGSNQAIVIVGWDDNPSGNNFALAWGVRWSGTATAANMLDTIAAHDSRFSYSISGGFVTNISYNDGTLVSGSSLSYWCYNVNNDWGAAYPSQIMANGDVMEVSSSCNYSLTTASPATDPNTPDDPDPVDATIDESAILYWVGTGENRVRFIVNWADTALAWGYRFSTESVVASDMMEAIAEADSRLTITGASDGFVTDIVFVDNGVTHAITPGQYWMYNYNGTLSYNYINQQSVFNGDVIKFGDLSVATGIGEPDDWGYYSNYAWTMPVYPASVPVVTGPFCGAVGTEGCDAIVGNSNTIVAWATECTVNRGYQNIAQPELGMANYRTDSEAVGPVTMGDNLSVVSLGDGGSALLTFARPITNGAGADFAVFENSFDDHFLELAFVEVSTDGERFVRFPATSYTQTTVQIGGQGQVDPTMINNLAGKYRACYGTPFDLEELRDSTGIDIDSIVYVRIVDVVGSIDPQYGTTDQYGNLVNDPWPTTGGSAGFDLDAVGVIHQLNTTGIGNAEVVVNLYPNPATDRVNVVTACNTDAELYDFTGRCVARYSFVEGTNTIDVRDLVRGVYMLRVGSSVSKIVKR